MFNFTINVRGCFMLHQIQDYYKSFTDNNNDKGSNW